MDRTGPTGATQTAHPHATPSVTTPPDRVSFSVGVETLAPSVTEAFKANNAKTNAVLAAQIGVGVFLTLALVHYATAFSDPNVDLEANRAAAKDSIARHKLQRISEGTPDSGRPGPPNWRRQAQRPACKGFG